MFPAASTPTAPIPPSPACVAGPLSPEMLIEPFPAAVSITPFVRTRRMRIPAASTNKTLSARSTTTWNGSPNVALVAAPPSPL